MERIYSGSGLRQRTNDYGIQRAIFVKFEFKAACIVAVDYFMKSKPLHACLLTYSHKINIKTTYLDEFGGEHPFTK